MKCKENCTVCFEHTHERTGAALYKNPAPFYKISIQ